MLQVGGADTVEDIQCPALEVGEHDVRPGQPLIDVGACRRVAGKMTITGALEAAVALPAVGLHNAAGGDRGARRGAQIGGARIGNDVQVGAAQASARRLLRRDGDHRLAGLAAPATGRSRALAADEALIQLDDPAQQELALATGHRMGDLATHQPGGLDRHAELAGQLGGRRRLLSGGQQPDCQEPLAQIGACVGEDRAGGQRALIVAARALEQPAAAQVPGTLVPTAATGEAVRPAVLEDRLPTVLLGRVQLHELNQRLGMCHLFCLLQVAAQEATRGTGRKGMGMYNN